MRTESSSKSSIMIEWSLSENNSYDSEGTFSVYFGFGNFEFLAGTTKDLFFEISGLVQNVDYTLRVELLYPYSIHFISATTHHLLAFNGDTNSTDVAQSTNTGTAYTTELPTNTEPILSYTMYTFIAVLVIFVILLILALFMCVLIMCAMKRRRSNKLNSRELQIQLPQADANEIYQTNPMAHSNKAFLCTGSVEVSKQTEVELDLKMPISVNAKPSNYDIPN